MSTYRRKGSPFYQYSFYWEGVRFRSSTKKKDKRAADRFEANLIRSLEAGAARKRPRLTINEAFGRYAEEDAAFHASQYNEEYFMGNLKDALGKDTYLDALDHGEISRYVAERRSQVADASVNREIELLRRVYRRAANKWRVDIGDMPDWSQYLLPEPAERVRELSADEEAALFKALRPDYHPLVLFALESGIRVGNLIALRWDQVNFRGRTISMKIKGGGTQVFPLTTDLIVILANEQGKHKNYVFVYRCRRTVKHRKRMRGNYYPFSKNGWRKAWWKALDSAKITDFRFHDLRHTFATRTMRATGRLKEVSKLLGHTDIATTNRYAHVTMDDLRAALDAKARHNLVTKAETESSAKEPNQLTGKSD